MHHGQLFELRTLLEKQSERPQHFKPLRGKIWEHKPLTTSFNPLHRDGASLFMQN